MQSPDRALFISQHGLCHQTVYGIPVVVTKTRVLVTLNWTPEPHHQSCRPPPSRPRHRRSLKVLIGCALFLAPVLKFLPRAVLQGVFFYMGIASLTGNNLFDRFFLLFKLERRNRPSYIYVQKLPIKRVHLYTLVQLICLAILYGLKEIKEPLLFFRLATTHPDFLRGLEETSVVFPFFMASLAIIRKALRWMFTPEELKYLDSYPDEDEEEEMGPQPDLENLPEPPQESNEVKKTGEKEVAAQKALQKGFLRLVIHGRVREDFECHLSKVGLEHGQVVYAIVQTPQLAASFQAFALWCCGGGCVTWGHPGYGGDSSAVQEELRMKGVQHIEASKHAFAALLSDGSVVAWGDPGYGGDCSQVKEQLKNVCQVKGTGCAFAAVRQDGGVVTWGHPMLGGDMSAVQDQLNDIKDWEASDGAFAALRCDGGVVTWGEAWFGSDSSAVQDRLQNVQQLQSSHGAFTAILADGAAISWGPAKHGGAVQARLRRVRSVRSSGSAFAALVEEGGRVSVVTWGHPTCGGDSGHVQDRLQNVQQIVGAGSAFAALLADGKVVTWGHPMLGGDSSSVALCDVQNIFGSCHAFSAIRADGTVVTWGHEDRGGDCSQVSERLHEVLQICGSYNRFAAVTAAGDVVTWGLEELENDNSSAQERPLSKSRQGMDYWPAGQRVGQNGEDSTGEPLDTRQVGMHHIFRGRGYGGGMGDQIYIQGHAAPGAYARAYLEGRLEPQT
eukprot:g31065.t1